MIHEFQHASLISIALVFVFSLSNCISNKMAYPQNNPNLPYLDMFKGACFGQCPSYRVSIYKDGTALFESRRFTEKVGMFTRRLSDNESRSIEQLMTLCQWETYIDYYESQLPDLQMTAIRSGPYSVKFKENVPEELRVLSNLLHQIATDGQWSQISNGSESQDFGQHEIIIKLKKGRTAQDLVNNLKLPELQIKKKISDHLNTYLIGYDSDKISDGQMYLLLKQHNWIEAVEFDIQLKLRED